MNPSPIIQLCQEGAGFEAVNELVLMATADLVAMFFAIITLLFALGYKGSELKYALLQVLLNILEI